MLINQRAYGYSTNKKYITGRGFVDTMSSVFNSIRSTAAPAFRNIGNYVSANKDLIAKPVLGAIGSLAAASLASGVPAIIKHIASRNRSKAEPRAIVENAKYKEILENILESNPVTNIIGSGIKSF